MSFRKSLSELFLGLGFHNCRGLFLCKTYSFFSVLFTENPRFEGPDRDPGVTRVGSGDGAGATLKSAAERFRQCLESTASERTPGAPARHFAYKALNNTEYMPSVLIV